MNTTEENKKFETEVLPDIGRYTRQEIESLSEDDASDLVMDYRPNLPPVFDIVFTECETNVERLLCINDFLNDYVGAMVSGYLEGIDARISALQKDKAEILNKIMGGKE